MTVRIPYVATSSNNLSKIIFKTKLYSMEAVISVLLSKWVVASSTIIIWTSWLQQTIYRSHMWVIVFYFPPILCSFQPICAFWSRLLYAEERVLSVEAPS
jgi:hypothetical protein